jgi:putative sterol carrier protein
LVRPYAKEFEFTGSAKGSCYFIIEDETIKAKKGKSERPDLIIKTPFDVWMDIVTGKADGAEMFMAGKYEVEGNTEFLDMNKFFGK